MQRVQLLPYGPSDINGNRKTSHPSGLSGSYATSGKLNRMSPTSNGLGHVTSYGCSIGSNANETIFSNVNTGSDIIQRYDQSSAASMTVRPIKIEKFYPPIGWPYANQENYPANHFFDKQMFAEQNRKFIPASYDIPPPPPYGSCATLYRSTPTMSTHPMKEFVQFGDGVEPWRKHPVDGVNKPVEKSPDAAAADSTRRPCFIPAGLQIHQLDDQDVINRVVIVIVVVGAVSDVRFRRPISPRRR